MEGRKQEALEEERVDILKVAQKVGKTFSGLTIASGIVLLIFSTYLTIIGPLTITHQTKLLFIVILSFFGIVNMISGLLIMGRN